MLQPRRAAHYQLFPSVKNWKVNLACKSCGTSDNLIPGKFYNKCLDCMTEEGPPDWNERKSDGCSCTVSHKGKPHLWQPYRSDADFCNGAESFLTNMEEHVDFANDLAAARQAKEHKANRARIRANKRELRQLQEAKQEEKRRIKKVKQQAKRKAEREKISFITEAYDALSLSNEIFDAVMDGATMPNINDGGIFTKAPSSYKGKEIGNFCELGVMSMVALYQLAKGLNTTSRSLAPNFLFDKNKSKVSQWSRVESEMRPRGSWKPSPRSTEYLRNRAKKSFGSWTFDKAGGLVGPWGALPLALKATNAGTSSVAHINDLISISDKYYNTEAGIFIKQWNKTLIPLKKSKGLIRTIDFVSSMPVPGLAIAGGIANKVASTARTLHYSAEAMSYAMLIHYLACQEIIFKQPFSHDFDSDSVGGDPRRPATEIYCSIMGRYSFFPMAASRLGWDWSYPTDQMILEPCGYLPFYDKLMLT